MNNSELYELGFQEVYRRSRGNTMEGVAKLRSGGSKVMSLNDEELWVWL